MIKHPEKFWTNHSITVKVGPMPRPRGFRTETVVDAAIEQFRSSSYAATSTDDLCACTGLSRSSLYNAFGNKAAMFRTALQHYDESGRARSAELLDDDASGRELVERMLRQSIEEQHRTPDRRPCMALAASVEIGNSDPEIAELVQQNLEGYAGTLTRLIERGQADGSIGNRMPAADLARMLHAMINGLQISGRVTTDYRTIEHTLDTALALL